MPLWYSQPSLLLAILFVVVGFGVLIKGADFLVSGAVSISVRFGMSLAVVGATVVAFGTSLPELVVTMGSTMASAGQTFADESRDPAAIALGNIVGSNIFNIGAILGLTALVKPLPVPLGTARRDYPLMLLALVALTIFCFLGDASAIVWWEAAMLTAGLLYFTWKAVRSGSAAEEAEEIMEGGQKSIGTAIGLLAIGIVMLVIGGDVALKGAVKIAEDLGMSTRVIGLTVMAIGTSLPELATSMQAARKGHTEIAVANVVGSNVFNSLAIVGISGLIVPLPVVEQMRNVDLWVMLGFSLVLIPWMIKAKPIGRPLGVFLLLALSVYVGSLIALG